MGTLIEGWDPGLPVVDAIQDVMERHIYRSDPKYVCPSIMSQVVPLSWLLYGTWFGHAKGANVPSTISENTNGTISSSSQKHSSFNRLEIRQILHIPPGHPWLGSFSPFPRRNS
jgi:hypothetical protein